MKIYVISIVHFSSNCHNLIFHFWPCHFQSVLLEFHVELIPRKIKETFYFLQKIVCAFENYRSRPVYFHCTIRVIKKKMLKYLEIFNVISELQIVVIIVTISYYCTLDFLINMNDINEILNIISLIFSHRQIQALEKNIQRKLESFYKFCSTQISNDVNH